MARTAQPNSASSQFYINVVDNLPLDTYNGGYAVFGTVINGMDTVDKIAGVKTKRELGFGCSGFCTSNSEADGFCSLASPIAAGAAT